MPLLPKGTERALFVLCPLLLLLFSGDPARSQTLHPKATTFDPSDYGGHAQILCAEPLSDGRTAFGTVEEVLFYYGEGFERVRVGKGKNVFSMEADSTGRVFVGGTSLMGVIAPDSTGEPSFRSLLPLLPDSLKDFGIIWNIVCTPGGEVYFNARDHLFRYDGARVTSIRPEHRFFQMHAPGSRPVIEDDDTGFFRIDADDKTQLPGTKELEQEKGFHAVLPSAEEDSGIWTLFTRSSGLYRYDASQGKSTPFPESDGEAPLKELIKAKIYTACRIDPRKNPYDAAYAVGTSLDGIYLLDPDGRIVLHLTTDDGLPADRIWRVAPDGKGNVCVTTINGMSLLHTGIPFTRTKKGERFKGAVVDISRGPATDNEERKSDRFFMATSQGVWKWMPKVESFSLLQGTSGQCRQLLPYASAGQSPRMLVAGGSAVLKFPIENGIDQERLKADTLAKWNPYSITLLPYPKGKGSLLIGGRSGMGVFTAPNTDKDGGWEKTLSVRELPEGVRSMAWDNYPDAPDSVRIWGGMDSKGVLSIVVDTALSGHRVVHYDTTDGLPKGMVRCFPDPSKEGRNVVFGTDDGLFTFEQNGFHPYSRYGPSFSDAGHQVFRIRGGNEGEVWILDGSGGHVNHLIPEGKGSYHVDSTVFRPLELGAVRTLLPETERTWIGGDQGIACYFPSVQKDPDKGPICFIRAVKGSGDSLLFGGRFFKKRGTWKGSPNEGAPKRFPIKEQPEHMVPVLPYSENRMMFKFAASYPIRQKAVEYRYKLSSFDTAWSDWTDKTRKEYTNLPEGTHTFRVKARNIYLKESRTMDYRFVILPPWYRTWSAYAGFSLAGVAFISLILWLNSRRLIAQKKRLESIVEERTKEIRDQKETTEEQRKEAEKQREVAETRRQKIEEAHEELQEAHKEITSSISYARKIQDALLQREEHVSSHVPEHFILFKPQARVSGDFYWGKEHKGYFYIAAVDCTGHGVPGAFMSMLGISQLNEIMNTNELLSPGKILTELRERVAKELASSDPDSATKDGMDAALLKIPIPTSKSKTNPNSKDQKSRDEGIVVEFAGAQNPLYVIRKGIGENPYSVVDRQHVGATHVSPLQKELIRPFKKSNDGIEIKGDPMPVGYDEHADKTFTTVKLQLQKEDLLYIFSDGYADQFGGPKGKKFRYAPFKQLLAQLDQKQLEEQKNELDRTFEDWKEESQQEQIDDVLVIGMRL